MRTRQICSLTLLTLFLVTLGAGQSAAGFQMHSAETYAEVPFGTGLYEFPVEIVVTGDVAQDVDVSLEYFLPPAWGGQYCQTSTGICYFNDQTLTLAPGDPDTIRVDFFPGFIEPGMGYLKLTLRDSNDPTSAQYRTFALFNGVVAPDVGLDIDCSDNTLFTETIETIEFFSPVTNTGTAADSVRIIPSFDVPAGWIAQFCEDSSGICYFNEVALPIGAGETLLLRVDFLTFGIVGEGSFSYEIHMTGNPSRTQRCYYRAFFGQFLTDAPDAVEVGAQARTWAEPSPFHGSTMIRLAGESIGDASLTLYSADGRIVRSFGDVRITGGVADVTWDGRDDSGQKVASGVYYYQFQFEDRAVKGVVIHSR